MKPLTIILPLALLALPVGAANVFNVDMTFTTTQTYANTGTYDWPDSPDQGPVTAADFFFEQSGNYTWKVNNGATISMGQSSGTGGRFFVGDATSGTLTITSDSGTPGLISARGNGYASMRIGNGSGSVDGTVNLDGGVSMDIGYLWSASTGNSFNILDGSLSVIVGDANYRFRNMDVTLGSAGTVWLFDTTGAVTDEASFLTYTNANSLGATAGQLVFTNGVSHTPLDGFTLTGTQITVVPEPSSALLMGGFLMVGAMFRRRH